MTHTHEKWTVDTLHAALNGRATGPQARLIAAAPDTAAERDRLKIALVDLVAALDYEHDGKHHAAWVNARRALKGE